MVLKEFTYFIDLADVEFAEGQRTSWLHAMPIGKAQHPWYGEMDFTEPALKMYADSVVSRVLGTVDPVIDYDHGEFTGKAAGWVKSARVQSGVGPDDGLQLLVEWTVEAAQQIKDKQYRYFSPTFKELWEDQNGTKHKNVIFGGGITNRPYLKNLVPLNLSDLPFGNPPADPTPTEDEVDLAKLREALGLATDAPEDQVWKTLGERLQPPTPPTPPTPPVPPEPILNLPEQLRELADKNPVVKGLIDAFESTTRNMSDMQKQLRESAVANKLGELDRSELILTPVSRELITDIAMALDENLAEKFWQLMDHVHKSNAFLVELGERGGSGVKYGRDKTATQTFSEKTKELVAQGMSYPDAVEEVGRRDPKLYNDYRNENFSFRA